LQITLGVKIGLENKCSKGFKQYILQNNENVKLSKEFTGENLTFA